MHLRGGLGQAHPEQHEHRILSWPHRVLWKDGSLHCLGVGIAEGGGPTCKHRLLLWNSVESLQAQPANTCIMAYADAQ